MAKGTSPVRRGAETPGAVVDLRGEPVAETRWDGDGGGA